MMMMTMISTTCDLLDVIAQEWIPRIIRNQSTAHASDLTSDKFWLFPAIVENSVLARISLTRNYGNYGNCIPHFSSEINARLLLFNKHFVGSLRPTSAREHFKVHAHILSGHEYLVNLSMSVVALRPYALNKCITMSPMCLPKQLQLL